MYLLKENNGKANVYNSKVLVAFSLTIAHTQAETHVVDVIITGRPAALEPSCSWTSALLPNIISVTLKKYCFVYLDFFF